MDKSTKSPKEGFVTRLYKWYMRKRPYSTILLIILFITIVILIILQMYWITAGLLGILYMFTRGATVSSSGRLEYHYGKKFFALKEDEQIEELKKFTKELIENKFTKGQKLNYRLLKGEMNKTVPERLFKYHELQGKGSSVIDEIIKNKKSYNNEEIYNMLGVISPVIIALYVKINQVDESVVKDLFDHYLKKIKKKNKRRKKKK